MKNNLQKSMMEKNQKKTKRNGVLWGIALGLCALNTQAQTDGQVLTRVAGGSSWANPVTDGDAWGVTGDVITGDIRRTGRVAIGINAAVDALTVTGGNNAGITILGTNAGITNENNQSLIFTKQGTTGTFHFRSGNNFSWENQDGTATHMSLSTNGDLDIANDVRVHGQFRDASGDAGNNTQILSSTGTGTNWVNAPTGDITSVTAGGGLTGTNQNAGAVTIHAAANSGLYVNATADRIRLGGELLESEPITLANFNMDFVVNGTGLFRILDGANDVFHVDGNGDVVVNNIGADNDFIVESDNDDNMLFVDGSADAVGIGTNTPSSTLHVNGSLATPAISTTFNASLGGTYAVAETDHIIVVSGSSSSGALTGIPAATDCPGRELIVSILSPNITTNFNRTLIRKGVSITSVNTGANAKTLKLVALGTNWVVVSETEW